MASIATSTPNQPLSATSTPSQPHNTSLTGRPIVTMTDDEDDDDLEEDDDDDEGYEIDQGGEGNVAGETTIKSGYLWKKGEKRKNWKKRWFVLRASKLAYYKNEKEYQLLRLLDMSEVHTVASVELKRNSYAFGIVTPKRTYYVKASSRAEMDSWITELTEVKTQLAMRSTLTQEMASVGLSDVTPPSSTNTQAIQIPGRHTRPVGGRNVSSSPGAAHSSVLGSSVGDESGAEQFGLSFASSASGATSQLATQGGKLAAGSRVQSAHSPSQSSAGELSDGGRITRAEAVQRAARDPSSGADVVGGGMLSSSDEDDDWDEEEKADQAMPLPDLLGVQPASLGAQQVSSGLKPANTPAGARDPNKIIMQGYLMKQSNRRKHWRKRWFVLTASKLSYMRSHMDDRSSRQIPLSSVLDAIEYTSKKNTLNSSLSPGLPTSPSGGGQVFNFGSFSDEPAAAAPEAAVDDKKTGISAPTGRFADASSATIGGTDGGVTTNATEADSIAAASAPATPAKAERRTSIKLPAPSSLLPGGGGNSSGKERETPSGSPALPHATLSPASPPGTPMISALKKRSKENCFRIITPKRTYVVCAPTEDEEIKWLGAIQALLTRSRGEAAAGTSPAPATSTAAGAAVSVAPNSTSNAASASSSREPSDSSTGAAPVAPAATRVASTETAGSGVGAAPVAGSVSAAPTAAAPQAQEAGVAVEAK